MTTIDIPRPDSLTEGVDPVASRELATELGLSPVDAWMVDAGCRDIDTGLFFSDDLDDIAEAKRTCLACPTRARCLDAAVDRGEQYGVWGGHLFVAGRIVLSKRRRGRPPKTPRAADTFPEVEVPAAYRPLIAAGV